MAHRYYNPFQAIDISVPVEFHKSFKRYSRREANSVIDQSLFSRMIDFWFLSVCVASQLGLKPVDIPKSDTVKIIDGAIFANDPWRIDMLMLLAISRYNDVQIVSEPRKIISLANGLAVAGIPKVIDMLNDGDAEPIWNLSDTIDLLLRRGEST